MIKIFQAKKERKIKKFCKMKEISQIFFAEELVVSIKGCLCLTQGQLANLKGQVEIKSTSSKVTFDTNASNSKKEN